MAAVDEEKEGRHHNQEGHAQDFQKSQPVSENPADKGDDYAHGKENRQSQAAQRRRRMQDVDPIKGNKGIAGRKSDGTHEDDHGQAAKGTPVVGLFFVRMGFFFGQAFRLDEC